MPINSKYRKHLTSFLSSRKNILKSFINACMFRGSCKIEGKLQYVSFYFALSYQQRNNLDEYFLSNGPEYPFKRDPWKHAGTDLSPPNCALQLIREAET